MTNGTEDQSALSASQRRFAKADATTQERALTLLDDGYTVVPSETTYGVYLIHTPPDRMDPAKTYEVDFAHGTCECRQFLESMSHGVNNCKHLLGLDIILSEAIRLVGRLIPSAALPEIPPVAAPAPAGAYRRPSDYRTDQETESINGETRFIHRPNSPRPQAERYSPPIVSANLPARGTAALDRQRMADFG